MAFAVPAAPIPDHKDVTLIRLHLTVALAALAVVTSTALASTSTVSATAYSPCSSDGALTASGIRPRAGIVADNRLPFGTVISVSPSVWGRTRYVVEDRGGPAMQLDFWTGNCSAAVQFGRRREIIRILSEPKR